MQGVASCAVMRGFCLMHLMPSEDVLGCMRMAYQLQQITRQGHG